ncbi:dynein light chain roadblock-type 2 [Folsomia candida]|uniref:dynein light chain roadblock-type 2 n=1 Tax=Folsomia candida TaxID=158441 RepID=UPI000B8F9508|nr:dynein light chain roadblock-type 2 [Folsomia candida]
MSNNEVEEAIKRIMAYKGVVGLIVINNEGIPIKSTLENSLSIQYAAHVTPMVDKTRSMIKELNPDDELTFIRLRTKKHEVLVCPEQEYSMIVIQNPIDT